MGEGQTAGALDCRDMRREGRVLPSGHIGSARPPADGCFSLPAAGLRFGRRRVEHIGPRPASAGGRSSRRRSVCDLAGGGRCGMRSRPRRGKAGEGPVWRVGATGEHPLPPQRGNAGEWQRTGGPQTAPRRRGRERDCLIGSSHRPTPASGSSSSPAAALWPTAAPGAGGRAGRCAKKRL